MLNGTAAACVPGSLHVCIVQMLPGVMHATQVV